MKLEVYSNGKGLIYGANSSRLTSTVSGKLILGSTEISLIADTEVVLPQIFNGASGTFRAEFVSDGRVYNLRDMRVKRGFIEPPNEDTVERSQLMARVDAVDRKCDFILSEIKRLDKIFDTNSLNFLIK